MSISAPLAVTMMIGTWLFLRSCRHTSMPEILGSITSSRTRSGRTMSKRSRASYPSTATSTGNPSRRETDRQGLDEARLVLDDEDHRRARWSPTEADGPTRPGRAGTGERTGTVTLVARSRLARSR